MARHIDVAGPQVGHQQLLAAKDIERQKAPVAIVAVIVAAFLLAVHPVIGGVKVEDQLRRRFFKGRDELFD